MQIRLLILFIIGFIFVGCSIKEAPKKLVDLLTDYNLTTVDFAYVKNIVDNLDQENNSTIIFDARDDKKYSIGHIPSAKLLTIRNFENEFAPYKDTDKNKEIIVYCSGRNCNKSVEVAKQIASKDFNNVKIYIEGISEWLDKDTYFEITYSMAKTLHNQNEAIFLDIGQLDTNNTTFTNNILKIPFEEFDTKKDILPTDKSSIIVIFNQKNNKQLYTIANKLLKEQYYNIKILSEDVEIFDLNTTPDQNLSQSNETIKAINQHVIDPKWLKEYIDQNVSEDTNITIVDVRTNSEYTSGHIKNAINIPYEFGNNAKNIYDEIKNQKEIFIFYCSTGNRSQDVILDLKVLKPSNFDNLFFLDASVVCDHTNNCQIIPNASIDF